MNRILNTTLVAAVASIAVASSSQAASEKALDQMMDTCLQQFVAANLANYPGKVVVKKAHDNFQPLAIADHDAYRITVTAVTRKSGTTLATGTCQMGRDGSIVSIATEPRAALRNTQHVASDVVAKNDAE